MKSGNSINASNIKLCFSQDIDNKHIKNSKTNVYIKGLPSTFTDEDILNLAQSKSVIRSVKVALEDDKRCKGYGFIDFFTPEEAKLGIAHILEKNPSYSIKFAKENEKDKTNLYVTNLPKSWTSKDSDKLKGLFEKYGTIQSAFIMLEKYGCKPLGVGFVRFFNEDSAYESITDLEKYPRFVSDECCGPLEAKFADKHAVDSRRKHPIQKSGSNGKLKSSNYLPQLSQTNSVPLLSGLFDDSYSKSPYLCPIPPTNINDAYQQYLLSVAQFSMIDPFCLLPTLVPASTQNYLSSFGDGSGQFGNFYPNIIYQLPPNTPADPVMLSSAPFVAPNLGHSPNTLNLPFIPNFNQSV